MSIDVNVTNDLVIVTETTEDIVVNVSNAAGPQGPAGAAGQGVPVGGTTNQVLKKLSNTNYDTYWALDAGGVPYSGATGNVDLGEYELKAGQFELDTTPTGTASVAVTRWNDTNGVSETTLKGGSVILKNGVDLVARVVNKVTPNATLTKAAYQAVRVSGAQGQRLAVALAQANNDANSADTIGLVTETIATNQEGFIMTVGQLENINTTGSLQGETWVDGDVLYLSPTTAGAITKVKPTGNGHIVVIGYVEYAHQNNGKIYVKVMNGWELDELHDVDIVTPANNEALIYESSTSLWKNKTIATALGFTPVTSARLINTTSPLVGGGDLSTDRTLSIPAATTSVNGYLTSTDWTTFNSKQNALGYTPVPTSRTLTINGTTQDLSADRTFTVTAANIYTADGTLTGNRTVTSGGYTLTFTGNLVSNSNVRAKGANDGTATGASTHIDFITALNYGRVQVYNYTTATILPLQLSASEVSIGGSPNTSTYQLNVQGSSNTLFSHSGDLSIALRSGATTSSQIFFEQSTTNKFSIGYVNATAGLRIFNWDLVSAAGAIFSATNNWSIGSTTDAGYRLDVNGTARVSSNLTASSFIKSGGTSSQYLMADGSTSTLTNPVTGTGTTNYLPKWTSGTALGNSIITDSGSIVTVGGVLSVSAANINLSNNYNLTGRNAANTLNLPLIGRNGSDRIDIDVDGYGTTIGGSGTIVLNPTGGNVGIGTASPAYKLDVNRSSLGTIAQFITLDGTYNPRLLISGTAEGIQLFATYSSAAEALMFGTANSEKMRLTSNLIIGSIVDNGSRLQVTGTATISSSVTASSFIKSGGTSSQYLMADGSVTTGGGGGSVDELQVALISQVYG